MGAISAIALPAAVLSGVTLHAGVFHLLLYFRGAGRLRAHLYFGITALLIALYDLCCVGLYNATGIDEGSLWQRMQMATVASAGLSFLYFVDAYAEFRGPRWVRWVAWGFPAIGAVTLVERHGLMLTEEHSIKRFHLPWFGNVTYAEVEVGPLYDVVAVGLVFVTLYVLWVAIQVKRAGEPRRSRNITSAIVVFSFGAFNDTLISERVIDSLYLLEYSWTAIVVLAGYALSNELLSAARSKQALAEGKVRLAHAERLESVGKLAGGVAHDLNNMLTPVVGYAQLAQNLVKPGSRERKYMDHLVSAAERAAALTRHLLAFARKQVLEVRPLDLGQSIAQLEPLIRRLLPENVQLTLEVDGEIPLVEADRAQLEQVWMNLASNARDAMPQGGALSFRVTRREAEGPDDPLGVLVTVRDTGVGMNSGVLDRAFDPFYSTKARGHGTGLGLSIVHGVVEQHGGKIWLKSSLGHGTSVTMFFPATDKQDVQAEEVRSTDADLQGDAHVLVVDDDRAVLRLSVELLEHFGYHVHAAGSLAELTALLASELPPIRLLLTDVVLPDTDGNQVQAMVVDRFPHVATVFMTGHADEVLAPRGVLREHVELLRKPFTAEELLTKLQEALERARLRAMLSASGDHGSKDRTSAPEGH